MVHDYTMNERYFIILLAILSVSAFYPVVYVLIKVHKNRGFDVCTCICTAITTIIYKICLAFSMTDLFLPQDSWHKLYNIAMLV